MGLDIYLRKCADRETARKAEDAHSAFTEELWSGIDYDSATEEQKADILRRSDAKAAELGITDNSVIELDTPSSVSPDHLFKLGYFRSSYNEGGIERILRNLNLPTMHDIFGYANDEHEFKPDWDRALVKVNEAITGYEAHLNSDAGKYLVTNVRPIWNRGVKTEAQARELVLSEMSRGTGFRSFSNGNGCFWLDGLKVVGVVTKTYEPPDKSDVIGQIINTPSVFVVYEREPDESGKEDWYLTALKIVRESIQFVIAQPDRQDFYLCWSS